MESNFGNRLWILFRQREGHKMLMRVKAYLAIHPRFELILRGEFMMIAYGSVLGWHPCWPVFS